MKKNVIITSFLIGILAFDYFVTNSRDLVAAPISPVQAYPSSSEGIRAISIKVLRQRLLACQSSEKFSKELLQLVGLKKILGYVIDRRNQDLIFYGYTGEDLPPLHLEDFVVALRNAWLKYAPLRNNTYLYSYPGCSIDPEITTLQELQRIAQEIASCSSFAQVEEYLKSWHQTCKEQQSVRVMGIPFSTRFAQVLVKADYDMKSIVDGSDPLDIPGLVSLTDMNLAKAKYGLLRNEPLQISSANLNRFWFYPGRNLYEEDEDIVYIKQCPVKLLTEEMYISSRNNLASAQNENNDAQQFAQSFSKLFNKISQEQSIYYELENLFRFVALAKLIKSDSDHEKASINLEYFLEDFPVSQRNVSESLPGRSAIKEFRHRTDYPGGYSITQLWLPSCGGVAIEINPKSSDFIHNSKRQLEHLKESILNSRGSQTDLYWGIEGSFPSVPEDIRLSQFVSDINHDADNFTALIIAYRDAEYIVYSGENDPLCTEKDPRKLIHRITSEMGKRLKNTVYLYTKDFPSEDKVKALVTSSRIYLSQKNPNVMVRTLSFEGGSQNLGMFCLSPGFRLDKQQNSLNDIKLSETDNEFEIPLLIKVKGRLKKLTVSFKSKDRSIMKQILFKIINKFRIIQDDNSSMLDFLSEIRHELKKDHDLEDKDIDFQINDEIGNSEIVILLPLAKQRTS